MSRVLKCHMWQVLKTLPLYEGLPVSIEDDWQWVRHFFVIHPDQEQLQDGQEPEWLQIEW